MMTNNRRCIFLFLAGSLILGLAPRPACGESPVELANPLVGTAPLDKQEFIGNAPPPGEEIYTGFVWPGPALPHQEFQLNPINKDLNLASGNHGIIFPYIWQRKTMLGFSSRVSDLTIMPLVGDWTTPPDRSYASPYDKNSEKASPGYYSVYFPDYQVKAELTTGEQVQYYRFTFPQTCCSIWGRGTMKSRFRMTAKWWAARAGNFLWRSSPRPLNHPAHFTKTSRNWTTAASGAMTPSAPARVQTTAATPGAT
jgi:hypothetical protein